MKLDDVLDLEEAERKARNLARMMKLRARRKDRKTPKIKQNEIFANHDGMVGHPTTFQGFINGASR